MRLAERMSRLARPPGAAFGAAGEGFLRLSYANSVDDLQSALAAMEDYTRTMRGDVSRASPGRAG